MQPRWPLCAPALAHLLFWMPHLKGSWPLLKTMYTENALVSTCTCSPRICAYGSLLPCTPSHPHTRAGQRQRGRLRVWDHHVGAGDGAAALRQHEAAEGGRSAGRGLWRESLKWACSHAALVHAQHQPTPMQPPCNYHATSMPPPCNYHATSMPPPCNPHAQHQPTPCNQHPTPRDRSWRRWCSGASAPSSPAAPPPPTSP